jgi:hypothetical protein
MESWTLWTLIPIQRSKCTSDVDAPERYAAMTMAMEVAICHE